MIYIVGRSLNRRLLIHPPQLTSFLIPYPYPSPLNLNLNLNLNLQPSTPNPFPTQYYFPIFIPHNSPAVCAGYAITAVYAAKKDARPHRGT